MPYKSAKQRAYLHANEPELARKWDKKYGGKVKKVWETDNPDFNHRAAQKAYDLIMKMDDDSAEMLVNAVVGEVLEDTIEKNLRTLQRRVNTIAKRRQDRVRKALVSKALKDPERVMPYAEAFTLIHKLTPYDYGYRFRESDFSRDPSTGRFRTKVTTQQSKPLNTRTAHAMGLPGDEAKSRGPRKERLSDKELAHYQDQYRQLANFMGTVAASGNPGDHDVIAHIRDKRTGQVYTTSATSTRPSDLKWDAKYEDLVGLDAKPTALTLGGAYFGLASALGAPASQVNMGRTKALTQLDQGFGDFATDWNRTEENDRYNTNARMYRRIGSGSELLQAAAPPGSKVALAARFGQFVGDHGSEAEAVFGPPTRKAAYRYRGTEKTPDRAMVRAYEAAVNDTKLAIDTDPYGNVPEDRRANLKRPKTPAPSQMAALRENAKRRVPTWEERANGRKVVAAHLENRMPKKGLYNLQLASGNTPPSEGVILDSKGRIVSQSVGYGDDHYLPFNLKNLKGLKGGEYIRTRSVGGPTTEDIYTGLMAGARQITVVSRSGTFTVEFEEDFRGGRRHNDKARRMTKRYGQLLDAVQSQQVDRRDVNQSIKDAIREEVKEEYAGYGLEPKELREKVRERIEEFKSDPELSEESEALARKIAANRALGTDRDANEFYDDALRMIAEEKEHKFRLNGVGYDAALRALQEQFPYYIKTRKNSPTIDPEGVAPNLDRGYVEPGRNRPTFAAAGLFGNAAQSPYARQGGKFSAADADYATYRKAPKKEAAGTTTEGTTPEESAEGEEQKKAQPGQAAREMRQRIEYAQAALGVQQKAKSMNIKDLSADDRAALEYTAADLRDEGKQRKFDEFYKRLISIGADLGEEGVRYKAAAGHIGQVPYDDDQGVGVWPDKPYTFGDTPDDKGRAKRLAQIDANTKGGIIHLRPLSKMNDAELKDEWNATAQLHTYVEAAGGEGLTAEQKVEALTELGVKRGAPGLQGIFDGEAVKNRLRAIHETRWLNQDVSDEDRGAGDIIVHNAPPPKQEKGRMNAAQERIHNFGESAKKAAKFIEDETTDEDLAQRLRGIAAKFQNAATEQIRTTEDADHFYEVNQVEMQMVNDVFRRMYNKAPEIEQKKENGGGSILT